MNPTTSKPTASALAALAGKYLTFRLGSESYCIEVIKIREIIRLTSITAVPQMPDFIKGVINLRGKIIPVLDLRTRFGLPAVEKSQHTCIIVVQAATASGGKTQIGMIVDAVEEVVPIQESEIEATPHFGAALETKHILGMAKIKGTVKTLLDLDRVLADGSLHQIALDAGRNLSAEVAQAA